MKQVIYTIGHSTNSLEQFLKLLKVHSITAIADVRSQPYSKFNPQFNREPLKESLRNSDIAYAFLGKELGARSEDRCCYKDGKVQYDILAQTPLFQEGISRVLKGANSYRLALMCSERDPLDCHRTILVAKALQEHSVDVEHILANGNIETQNQLEQRLLNATSSDHKTRDLFLSEKEKLERAYAARANEIAYNVQSDAMTA